jgi:hypothetical protein
LSSDKLSAFVSARTLAFCAIGATEKFSGHFTRAISSS